MTKVAVLIDGWFFLKCLPKVRSDIDAQDAKEVVGTVNELVHAHLVEINKVTCLPNPRALLYRVFYYDARPFDGKLNKPVSDRILEFATTPVAKFRQALFRELHQSPSTAVRLEWVRPGAGWILKKAVQDRLMRGEITVAELKDGHFRRDLRQKAVDMRIGIDIASLTLKKQANIIVLVAGDADFVPAAKLARREGASVVLDSLGANVGRDLDEHIDELRSGWDKPEGRQGP